MRGEAHAYVDLQLTYIPFRPIEFYEALCFVAEDDDVLVFVAVVVVVVVVVAFI